MQKILDYFNNLNDQARYCVVVGVIFLVILLDVVFLVLPQMADIAHVNDQIRKLSDDTQEVLTDKPRINLLRKNLQQERDQAEFLSSKVRSIQEVPAILSTIATIANEYGVNIDQLVPEKSQQVLLASASEGKYYTLPVMIKAHCGYHRFGHFINTLENGDLYFLLSDFIIQNEGNDPKVQSFSLTIKLILVDRSWSKNP